MAEHEPHLNRPDSGPKSAVPEGGARVRRWAMWLGLFALAAALGLGFFLGRQWWEQKRFDTVPPQQPGREVSFVIPPGSAFITVARDLHEQGLITEVPRFVDLALTKNLTGKVRAGEFHLSTGWLPGRILTEITTSPGVMQRFTVREGLSWWQVAALVEENGLGTAGKFAAAVHDPELLAEYDIPAESAEGYLFPETYMFTRAHDLDERRLVRLMIAEFFRKARGAFGDALPEPGELHRLVVLASIVEKETGDPSERFRIAGVYANRLERPMRLQADPTTIYGLGPEFDGNLRHKHLADADNPYNTYQIDGLPPGPICSPGIESLKAAAFPEPHKYLYFVAKGDGTSYFSKTLVEHNRAVARYQRWGRDRENYRSTRKAD